MERQKQSTDRDVVELAAAGPTELDSVTGTQSVHEVLIKHKEKCAKLEIMRQKVTETYKHENDMGDEAYADELKRQSHEINELILSISKEQMELRTSCKQELKELETSMMQERTEMVHEMYHNWEMMLKSLRTKTVEHLEGFPTRAQEHTDLMDQARTKDAEDMNVTRDSLESEVHVLTQQLEQMKAMYLLNMEKLEYNFQILKKRDDENSNIVTAQKRRINRMHDNVTSLRKKILKQQETFDREYQQLQDDYSRINDQFNDLKTKLGRVHANNQKLFFELWDMHAGDIKEVLQKISLADRIIWEEQLGLSWICPDELRVFVDEMIPLRTEDVMTSSSANQIAAAIGRAKIARLLQTPNSTVVVDLISHEIGHLIIDASQQELIRRLDSKSKIIAQAECFFSVFGISTESDVETLVQIFTVEGVLVTPDSVMTKLKHFSAHKLAQSRGVKQKDTIVPVSSHTQDLQHWEKLIAFCNSTQFKTWERVHNAMKQYHAMLKDRQSVAKECDSLEDENKKLRGLLSQQNESDISLLMAVASKESKVTK